MKLLAKYKPEKVTCKPEKDAVNRSLEHCMLDTARGRLVATNRHMIAVLPVTVGVTDSEGLISPEALKGARKEAITAHRALVKLAREEEDATLELRCLNSNGLETPEGECYVRPTVDRDQDTYPPVDNAIPPAYSAEDADTCIVGLNVKYLLALAEALGASAQTNHAIELRIKLERRPLGEVQCSKCGQDWPYKGRGDRNWNACPKCGVKGKRKSISVASSSPIEVRTTDSTREVHEGTEPLGLLMPLRL